MHKTDRHKSENRGHHFRVLEVGVFTQEAVQLTIAKNGVNIRMSLTRRKNIRTD